MGKRITWITMSWWYHPRIEYVFYGTFLPLSLSRLPLGEFSVLSIGMGWNKTYKTKLDSYFMGHSSPNHIHGFQNNTKLGTYLLRPFHYNDVIMGAIASQSPASWLFTQPFIQEDQRKHQSSASLDLVHGIHRWPMNSPHKWPVTRKTSPFHDVIMLSESPTKLPIGEFY